MTNNPTELPVGDYSRLGSTPRESGTDFALFSAHAEAVELCLFDANDELQSSHYLQPSGENIWHGFAAGIYAGQRYGYRVHGPYQPEHGHRFNAKKLLIDPYARQFDRDFRWSSLMQSGEGLQQHESDSAAVVPKSLVCANQKNYKPGDVHVPWDQRIIYETHVRGYTMQFSGLSEAERGRFKGMRNADLLKYIKALGVTSVQIMPVHTFMDETHLVDKGLRNFWGYNSIGFFAPTLRYAHEDAHQEFRQMVSAIHQHGLEVILDVVYNHTAESDEHGPTLAFRGIDNHSYYRLIDNDKSRYENSTGCGNSLDTQHPFVRRLIQDSLVYWHQEMDVDGFRFDLASNLGRSAAGFDKHHPLLEAIEKDNRLKDAVLIAEPWDIGEGGYQLGQFGNRWLQINDRFRDATRRYWAGHADQIGAFARRIHGSADLFANDGHTPAHSVNYVTCHDGFTLNDLVCYEKKHNHANGEDNRDGHSPNFSVNHGVEGDSDDRDTVSARRQHRLNLLSTLLLSHGTPLLLAGDEFGNSQQGNNNAYCQDNPIGWLDWHKSNDEQQFTTKVRQLIAVRKRLRSLLQHRFRHADSGAHDDDISWLTPSANAMTSEDWRASPAFTLILADHPSSKRRALCVLFFNTSAESLEFQLPSWPECNDLVPIFDSAFKGGTSLTGPFTWKTQANSVVCLIDEYSHSKA